MERTPRKMEQVFLWILLIGGFLTLLLYGLSSFVDRPTVETITIHETDINSNVSIIRQEKLHNHKTR